MNHPHARVEMSFPKRLPPALFAVRHSRSVVSRHPSEIMIGVVAPTTPEICARPEEPMSVSAGAITRDGSCDAGRQSRVRE